MEYLRFGRSLFNRVYVDGLRASMAGLGSRDVASGNRGAADCWDRTIVVTASAFSGSCLAGGARAS